MKKRSAFTLVEILVVLAIIAILAALLFPAFNRARETGRQTSCISNLNQIYFAVQQYRKDEGRYPDSILDLLGEGTKFDDGAAAGTLEAKSATGYLKGGASSLTCPDDDSLSDVPRSSYGFLSTRYPTTALPAPTTSAFTGDYSQFVWNFWGYRDDGFAYNDYLDANAKNGNGAACTPATPANNPCKNLVNVNLPYDRFQNPVKYSMSNRAAPTSTIITHCIYHRLPTSKNLTSPGGLYDTTDPTAGDNARDIVLRLDGTVATLDVTQFKPSATTAPNLWQVQTP